MKQVISFSRRTDGVAFYMNRLEKAIEEGNIEVRNPFNNKISHVSLKPQDVAGFVLWSKNFKNLLSKWEIFKKYKAKNTLITDTKIPIYFHFTRNSIVKILEPLSPTLEESFSQMRELVEITSPEHIMWRFDPIVFWIEDGLLNDNIKDFSEIAAQLSDIGLKNCTISFATYYKKVEHRMLKSSFHYYKPTVKEMIKTTQELVIKAKKRKIKIFVCCNPDLLKIPDISQAHCIDGNYLSKLWNIKLSLARDTGQREACGCTKSRDIGGYNKEWQCHHGCLYCYANPNQGVLERK
ncbi:hypothetical protein LCGC14_0941800 [marine sediment metagenome]|uniref:DUF1848 domain-containing protein n=1 Tax=marine sediment metagenome TaxID=412755 RepID=A0A0F9R3J1_9ZZZZ